MSMSIVTITETYGDRKKHTVRLVERETEADTVHAAVVKLFGHRAFWWPDSGLRGYGQVMEAVRPTKKNGSPGSSAITYKVRLDLSH